MSEALTGPGTIERRQSTFWDLVGADGTRIRAHFQGKVEFACPVQGFAGVAVLDAHPLLVDYAEPWAELYLSNAAAEPGPVTKALESLIEDQLDGWRGLASYANRDVGCLELLAQGRGLLLRAPQSVVNATLVLLQSAGVRTRTLPGRAERPGKAVLLLGTSYVIASGFTLEVRDQPAADRSQSD